MNIQNIFFCRFNAYTCHLVVNLFFFSLIVILKGAWYLDSPLLLEGQTFQLKWQFPPVLAGYDCSSCGHSLIAEPCVFVTTGDTYASPTKVVVLFYWCHLPFEQPTGVVY